MPGAETFFTVLFIALIICAVFAAYFHIKSAGIRHAQNTPGRKTTMSALRTEGFNRQEYVTEKMSLYGVCNMGTSLDEREIYRCSYSRIMSVR